MENKMEESNKNEKKENPIIQGWNNFASNIKTNFINFQDNLKEQSKKNIEKWNENQEKIEHVCISLSLKQRTTAINSC